jgi:hypothetical protein
VPTGSDIPAQRAFADLKIRIDKRAKLRTDADRRYLRRPADQVVDLIAVGIQTECPLRILILRRLQQFGCIF